MEAVGYLVVGAAMFLYKESIQVSLGFTCDCILYVGRNIMLSGRFFLLWVVETKNCTFRETTFREAFYMIALIIF